MKEQLLLLEKDYQNILSNLVSINSIQGFTVLQGQAVWATVPGCEGAAPIVREGLPEHHPQSNDLKFKVLLYYRAKEYELQYLDVKEQLLLLEKDYQNILPIQWP